MARPESPCLSIAIARMKTSGANHFATWVLQAPYPSGYVHHDCMWPDTLSQAWQAWQEMFFIKLLQFQVQFLDLLVQNSLYYIYLPQQFQRILKQARSSHPIHCTQQTTIAYHPS